MKRLVSMFLTMVLVLVFAISATSDVVYAAESYVGYTVKFEATHNFDYAYEALSLVNAERAKVGAEPLTMDNDLLNAAMIRATETAVYFSHDRPDGSSFSTVSKKALGENIAAGYATPDSAVTGWVNSQEHYTNMTSKSYKSVGIGVLTGNGLAWVMLFGRDSATAAAKPANATKVMDLALDTRVFQPIISTYPSSDEKLYPGSQVGLVTDFSDGASSGVTLYPGSLEYNVSDSSVLSADNNSGVVNCLKAGSAKVTSKLNEFFETSRELKVEKLKDTKSAITQSKPEVLVVPVYGKFEHAKTAKIQLNTRSMTLRKGETGRLTAIVLPKGAPNRNIYWQSGNSRIATVDSNGFVRAMNAGSTAITAYSADGKRSVTCLVTVIENKKAPAPGKPGKPGKFGAPQDPKGHGKFDRPQDPKGPGQFGEPQEPKGPGQFGEPQEPKGPGKIDGPQEPGNPGKPGKPDPRKPEGRPAEEIDVEEESNE